MSFLIISYLGKNKMAANLFEGKGSQQGCINISHLVEHITGFLLMVKPKQRKCGLFAHLSTVPP